MRRIQFPTILFLFATLFLVTACSKDEEGPDPGSIPVGSLVAKINGEEFSSTIAAATLNEVVSLQLFSIFGVSAMGPTIGESMIISFTLPLTQTVDADSYQFTGSNCDPELDICGILGYGMANTTDPDSELSFSTGSNNGTLQVTISSIDFQMGGSARGTFSGVGEDDNGETVNVTEGSFNVLIN